MKTLMFVVSMFVSALAYGAEVNQEIVFKKNAPAAVPQTKTQIRQTENVIPAAGLISTQVGGAPVVQAPVQTGSKTIHRSPRQGQRLIGATPGRQIGVGRQVIGGSAPMLNGYITTAPASTVPANVNVYVGAPVPPSQPFPARSGFWKRVGQATGFGPLFTENRPEIAEYAATHGAVGASQFSGVPYQTVESVSASTWDNRYQPYGWGSRPNTSKGSYYGYSRVTQPAYGAYVPDGAAPTSYLRFESVSQRSGPQDYGVQGGSTQTFHLFGRH